MKVLIIEDERLVARVMTRMLRAHEVTVVDEIAQLQEPGPFDVAFCDAGFHTTDEIRNLMEQVTGTFVLMSGEHPTDPILTQLIEDGIVQWLAKPFKGSDIRRLVDGA